MFDNPANKLQATYREYTYVLPIGDEINLSVDCRFIACLEATGDFALGFENGAKSPFRAGLTFKPPRITRSIQIRNTSGAVNTLVFGIGNGDFRDSRLQLTGNIGVSVPGTMSVLDYGSTTTGPDTVTALATVAENLNRKEAIFYNAGIGDLFIRPDNTASLIGIPLVAGGTAIVSATNALWVVGTLKASEPLYVYVTEIGFAP